jgi:hypothetical protein
MFNTILGTLGTTLMGMLVRLMTAQFIEKLVLYVLEYGASLTKVQWDNELVEMVKSHLRDKKATEIRGDDNATK